MAIDPWEYILEWWSDFQADPRSNANDIESGLREGQTGGTPRVDIEPTVKYNWQTGSCQYWVNGLPTVCDFWDPFVRICTYEVKPDDIPTGYGVGQCDGLGRRSWCSKYVSSQEFDPDERVCVLPCIERSGSGRIDRTASDIELIPWNPDDIQGYNPDADNVGRCDGNGLGRGPAGIEIDDLDNLLLLPQVCKHYKPHQMGFGAVTPRPYHGDPPSTVFKQGQTYIPQTPAQLYDGSAADPLVMMSKRLPFTFEVYNQRAQFQKCAHWDADFGSAFYFDGYGSDPSDFTISIDEEATSYCKKYQEDPDAVRKFVEISDSTDVPYVLYYVWAKYGGVVCNGAKPECPCYTGKWIYCIDRNMRDGMRISANQIFELRFWASSWGSQEEYDRFYEAKPGKTDGSYADITTADMYTFTKWQKLNPNDPNESIMQGNKHHMCMPAPLQDRYFDPELYITIEEVTYPKVGDYIGTPAPGEVAFPTLVRQLDSADDIYPDLLVIYPYFTTDPWDFEVCDEQQVPDYCLHDNNLMYEDPTISVVGNCTREKEVWVVNYNYIKDRITSATPGTALIKMRQYVRAQLIPDTEYEEFCTDVETYLAQLEKEDSSGFATGTTDENGFFRIDGVALNNNRDNEIFIICKFLDGDNYPLYVYTIRNVRSRYFGGLITQSSFNGGQGESSLLDYFSPAGTMTGNVQAINGEVYDVFPVYSEYRYNFLLGDKGRFSYCINENEEVADDVEEWTQVGMSEYIWVEIPDINITYLWDFEVTEATLTPIDENFDGSTCGEESASSVTLTPVELTDAQRKMIPPSAVLLKNEEGIRDLRNSDWTLDITYKYQVLQPFRTTNVIFPTGLDDDPPLNEFVNAPFQVDYDIETGAFSIPSIGGVSSRGTAAVMALIVDPDTGRTQAAAATKLLMQGYRLQCRNVEIKYSWTGDATVYDLVPKSGFNTWVGAPAINAATSTGRRHVRTPTCGDHNCSVDACIGPMWYPYNACTGMEKYNVRAAGIYCTISMWEGKPYVDLMGPGAWRYSMAPEYEAWTTPGGNWASACGSDYYYHYSYAKPSQMQFTGYAKIISNIDTAYYILRGWELPPFGNVDRGLVERWLIRDFASFYRMGGPQPVPQFEYMPLVLDREDIVSDLDAFRYPGLSSHEGLNEPFWHRSMLSNFTADWIEEEMSTERYRFDEVLEVVHNGNCMYPWPSIASSTGAYSIARYGFKNEDTAWVWPEYWKPLERATTGEDPFLFLSITRPDYYYDLNKKEHRFIAEEGIRQVMFRPPEPAEDGEPSTYASISIDGVHWRYFDIEYDAYTGGELVDWQDESAVGDGNGSGGDGGSNESSIYELANNGPDQNYDTDDGTGEDGPEDIKWIHDFNTVFDTDAEPDPSEDRKALVDIDDVTDEPVYGYYNPGLIFHIYKDKLDRLPMDFEDIGYGEVLNDRFGFGYAIDQEVRFHFIYEEEPVVPAYVEIWGRWGVGSVHAAGETLVISQPEISFGQSEDPPPDPEDPVFPSSIYFKNARAGATKVPRDGELLDFYIKADLGTYPDRMLHPPTYFQLKLTPDEGESMLIDNVVVQTAAYKEATENVQVWERKYYASVINNPGDINADGPNTQTYRSYDRNNKYGGQYFPATGSTLLESGGSSISKTTIANAGEVSSEEEEDIPVTRQTLKTVEATAQKDLYDAAYESDNFDEIQLTGKYPPDIDYFLTNVIGQGRFSMPTCKLIHTKVDFSGTSLYSSFTQEGEIFAPGGHSFAWSDSYFETRCTLIGPVKKVYLVDFKHKGHGGDSSPAPVEDSYSGQVQLDYMRDLGITRGDMTVPFGGQNILT